MLGVQGRDCKFRVPGPSWDFLRQPDGWERSNLGQCLESVIDKQVGSFSRRTDASELAFKWCAHWKMPVKLAKWRCTLFWNVYSPSRFILSITTALSFFLKWPFKLLSTHTSLSFHVLAVFSFSSGPVSSLLLFRKVLPMCVHIYAVCTCVWGCKHVCFRDVGLWTSPQGRLPFIKDLWPVVLLGRS